MAETQDASIGWGGEVKLKFSGTTFTELMHVKGFTLPSSVREQIDATHLKSAGRRPTKVAGMYQDSDIAVKLNYRPGTDTDTKLLAAVNAGTEIDADLGIPINGVIVMRATCKVVVTGYSPDEITTGLMTASATLSVRSDPVYAAVP